MLITSINIMSTAEQNEPKGRRERGVATAPEEFVLRAVRDLTFGVVEVVVHDGRITEIRQTRRTRVVASQEI